jgi:hypothetical protein
MNFDLHPSRAAGPLRIGATGHDTVEILKQLGTPLVLCRAAGSPPAWGVHRPSGLFISTLFDADDHLEATQFGRPDSTDDAVTYDGLDVFTTPAADLITHLRQRTTVHQEQAEDGHVFTAPSLLLSLWQPVTPQAADDQEGLFFQSVLIARPGYYDQPAEPGGPSRE